MSKTFRPKRTPYWASIAALAFFPAVGAVVIAFFLFGPEVREEARVDGAIWVGLLFGFLSLQAVYEFVACHRKELTLSSDGVTKRGVFGETTFGYADVREVRWGETNLRTTELRGEPSGGSAKKLEIEFVNLDRREALDLIRTLRARLSHAEQVDWERFCRRYAIPLRDSVNGVKRSLRPDERRLTRKRWSLIFAPSIVVCGLVAVGYAHFTGSAAGFVVIPLLAVMWAILHFGWPREGQIVRRRTPEEKRQVWLAGGAFVLFVLASFVAVPWFQSLFPPPLGERAAAVWIFSAGIAVLSVIFWAGSRLAETQKERETVESFGAAEEWEEGEQIVFVERDR